MNTTSTVPDPTVPARLLERTDGFAPLGAYAALGDGRAGALVAADGAIDWFAAPTLTSAPVCAALLDPDAGGAIIVRPSVPARVEQRYLEDTMVVQTTFHSRQGSVRVTDALTRGAAGLLPWTELVRSIEATDGEVPMLWTVRPGHRLGSGRPWTRRHGDLSVIYAGSTQLAVVNDGAGATRLTDRYAEGEFIARAGAPALLAIIATETEPLSVPSAADLTARLETTKGYWRQWCARIRYAGPHRDAVVRAALLLRALTMAPTSGIAAALTTSLPERIGGPRNFDYRFGWVRDASFALDALDRLGLSEAVHGSLSWLLRAVRKTAPAVRSMYSLDGAPAPAAMSGLERLPGYRDSRPVHLGNEAAQQTQLGGYGDLLDAVWRYVSRQGLLDPASAGTVAGLADHVCEMWRVPDAGIWELGDEAHYTISKIGCWVALDRAIRLAEGGQLTSPTLRRWRVERDAVRKFVERECWSPIKRSLTFYAGTDELDASVLLAARTGFLPGADPRLGSTIDAVRAELTAEGPLLYRYTGMAEQEGAFLACTFWLVEALVHAGRVAEARTLLDQALGYAGHTGLLSEEVDPGSGALRGNIPQALSHLALIGAATALAREP